ncbi:MAG: hypothetical protein H0T53_01010 [Herpetosiphonaceae bacterium]|nr:hypothetical protein [Herpetosiphonaceae bacterium]
MKFHPYNLIILLVIISISLIACGQEKATITPAISYALSDGWKATIDVEPQAKSDKKFSITFTITPIQNVSDVDIHILLPTGIQLISGSKTVSDINVSAHQQYVTTIEVLLSEPDTSHLIGIQALGTHVDGYRATAGAEIYLNAVDGQIVTSTKPLYEITNQHVPAIPVSPYLLPSDLTPLPKIRN